MVEAQLRNVHVSILPGSCDPAEGVQEALFHSIAEAQYVSLVRLQGNAKANREVQCRSSQRPQEHETLGRPSFRTL